MKNSITRTQYKVVLENNSQNYYKTKKSKIHKSGKTHEDNRLTIAL